MSPPKQALPRSPVPIPMEMWAAEALALPADERSRLLDCLLARFDPEPLDPAWKKDWSEEIDRREAAIASGRADWVAGGEVVARLRAQLK